MSTKKTGGPAFPVDVDGAGSAYTGMDLRDYLAAKAMQGYMLHWWTGLFAIILPDRFLAEQAYNMADQMLKAREQ
jgi:hypothetical protein